MRSEFYLPLIWKILNIQTRGGKLIKGLFGLTYLSLSIDINTCETV
jgi:hypothetical protein